jgi:polysaccharide export outer membrane protein
MPVNFCTVHRLAALLVLGGLMHASPLFAQASKSAPSQSTPAQTKPQTPPAPTAPAQPQGVPTPADYLIGSDDVLSVLFWSEKNLSSDVVVRPDGKITLPLLNDVQASGLTPEQLRKSVMDGAARFVTDPNVTIVVKTINSRKVYVTGQVNKPGTFPLTDSMTVLQMLALAGGLQEYADAEKVLVMRIEQGQTKSFKFNYKDVRKGKNLQQNILLKPGDTIVVP